MLIMMFGKLLSKFSYKEIISSCDSIIAYAQSRSNDSKICTQNSQYCIWWLKLVSY
jgi:hypothetical protein